MIHKLTFVIALCLASVSLEGAPIKTPQHVFSSLSVNMDNHPGDYPFPTDMTFIDFADHSIIQITEYFDPDTVQKGDIIYLADWYIGWFTKYVHPKIKYPYILVSNDSDGSHPDPGTLHYNEQNGWPLPIDATRTLLYDSKVTAWFCKNLLISRHPKIFQIPIGQNIIYWGKFRQKDHLLNLARKGNFNKKYLLYINMQMASHPSRPIIASLFRDKPYCFSRIDSNKYSTMLPREQFYDELSEAIFTVAPPGYGPDTVRFWEALVLGCIPIVKHYELDDLYADLPVLFVHDWSDINEELLIKKQKEISDKHISTEKAYFDYWAAKILDVQQKVRNDQNTFSSTLRTKFNAGTLERLSAILKQNIGNNDALLCKGAVMGLRPFELAQKCGFISRFFVHDKWGALSNEHCSAHLERFINDPLLSYQIKMTPISWWDDPYTYSRWGGKTHVFLDLSYLRHDLPQDLERAYANSSSGTLICGNMGDDTYVKEVLERYSKKTQRKILFVNDIWYFKKI